MKEQSLFTDLIEDKFANTYEEINFASTHFGIERKEMIIIAMLREMSELNRNLNNLGRKFA